jgi:DNA processing protein
MSARPGDQALQVEALHREDARYPAALARCSGAPAVLHVAGGAQRLQQLLESGAVAIAGTRRASDYGMETARGLARGLAASGVTVIAAMADGIAAAAHMGALEAAGARTVTVMPGGLDVCYPASRRTLYERVRTQGCAVSELPCGVKPRRFSDVTRRRILAALAQLVIVVEAEQQPSTLFEARFAQQLGRTVAAVPGRVVHQFEGLLWASVFAGYGQRRCRQEMRLQCNARLSGWCLSASGSLWVLSGCLAPAL